MKLCKIAFVVLLFLVNLVITPPSWAEAKYTANPDYIEITQTLDSAIKDQQAQGITPESVQKIADLRFQKYILETGKNGGECRNETGKTLIVYGQKHKKAQSTTNNTLYFLPDGQQTDDEWDCEAIYLPSDVKVAGLDTAQAQEPRGAVAYKVVDGTKLIAKTNPETSEIEFNVPPAKIIRTGEPDWLIPETLQAALDTKINTAPIDD